MTATHLSTVHTQDFNGSSTGDQQATPTISNGFSRRDLLLRIMFSGEVTRVGQHLALVIFFLVDENGCASVSARDLERITGWTKTAIMDHLAEIEVFIRINYGRGRAKHVFELQGIITDEARKIASVQRPDKTVREDLHSFVREPDTNLFSRLADRSAFVREMGPSFVARRLPQQLITIMAARLPQRVCGKEAATIAAATLPQILSLMAARLPQRVCGKEAATIAAATLPQRNRSQKKVSPTPPLKKILPIARAIIV